MGAPRWPLAALAAALALARPVPLRAGPPEAADVSRLVGGFIAGDDDEVARSGGHLGARGLTRILGGGDRLAQLAAIAAAPAADDAPLLLQVLAAHARGADRPIAERAARAAARIAGAISRDEVLLRDLPRDFLRARIAEYRALGADAHRWADVRVAGLEVAARLHQALGAEAAPTDAPFDPAVVLADRDPEVRRAALELMSSPLSPGALSLVAAHVTAETVPLIALVAGQVACDGIAAGDPARPVLAALGAAGLVRLRQLVATRGLPLGARLGAAHCLAADPSPKSRAALATLPPRRRSRRR
jgi:CRP-like cAMP-binding protein